MKLVSIPAQHSYDKAVRYIFNDDNYDLVFIEFKNNFLWLTVPFNWNRIGVDSARLNPVTGVSLNKQEHAEFILGGTTLSEYVTESSFFHGSINREQKFIVFNDDKKFDILLKLKVSALLGKKHFSLTYDELPRPSEGYYFSKIFINGQYGQMNCGNETK